MSYLEAKRMSLLDQIFKQAGSIQPSANQWMVSKDPETPSWAQPIPAPANDPFGPTPWRGVDLPAPVAIRPAGWMERLYADLKQRLEKGLELLDQPGLTDETKASYDRRIKQLAWQMHMLELVVRELAPCPPTMCRNRVGGGYPGMDPDLRDRYVWDMRQAHAAGLMAVTLTTPGGRKYQLVPWRSQAAGELDPLDLAALARVAALAGTDELTLLDLLPQKEVSTST